MKLISTYIPVQQIERIDILVKYTGISRAEYIRRAIDTYLIQVSKDYPIFASRRTCERDETVVLEHLMRRVGDLTSRARDDS